MLRTLLFALAALAFGCAECEEDFDCPGTQLCNTTAGECEAFVCKQEADCPPGHACSGNRCSEQAPATATPPTPDALVLTPGANSG